MNLGELKGHIESTLKAKAKIVKKGKNPVGTKKEEWTVVGPYAFHNSKVTFAQPPVIEGENV